MKPSMCAGCREQIYWRYAPSGAKLPLDAEPVPAAEGTYVIEDGVHCRSSEPMFDGVDVTHHRLHWASCPFAEQLKKHPR